MRKVIFFVILTLVFGCATSYYQSKVDISNKGATTKNYLNLSPEELSLYMGYQASLMYGDIEKAESLIKELIEKRGDFIEPYIDLINIYVFQKKLREAEEVIKKLEDRGVENENLMSTKANIYLMKGDLERAIPLLNKILESQPDRENIYLILANIYYQNNDYNSALKVLEKLIKIVPNSFFGNLYLGKIYETIEDNKKAAEYYERAFKEREEDEILMNLDRVYDKLGERLKSIEVLEKFLSLNPDFPKVRERLAILYIGENNYDKALF
ncbi:MAG: tetratricopeptide repeat protein, partial [Proteobacteria bacterium]|nr:tetratricopeptide repeat protein [Pseudomonadota bacterium]